MPILDVSVLFYKLRRAPLALNGSARSSEPLISDVTQLFHAYVFGSAFWYTVRAACRIYDPEMVIGWFRPPAQRNLIPNDLEIYNIRTDAWGLLTIALMLVVVSGAVPIPGLSTGKTRQQHDAGLQPYAKAAILADVFHHVMTGVGAWNHYVKDTHYNTSMGVGVWGCSSLAVLGLLTLVAPPKISGLGYGGKAGKVN
ncbi:Peroxisomal membrane protein LPX1 [Sphaceloma murrayae]|uniref:Peroxisomal membrane protein LPX1 n=1 Tax=Sphaceloma murrayae TaxID=2082308 RepID=A0A2K1R379_9PEZI|nr:Peroxisomal membrane protein LPX1 [Sphaceloma murrayae]